MNNSKLLHRYLTNPLFEFNKSNKFDEELEAKYRNHELSSQLQMFRYMAVFGMFLYGGFYIADIMIIETRLILHQIIRLMIVLPMSLFILFLSFKEFFYSSRFYVESSILFSLILGQMFHFILSYPTTTPQHYYFIVTLTLVLWGNSFPILTLTKKTVFSIVNLFILIMYLKYFQKIEDSIIYFQIIAYCTIMIISLLSAYLYKQNSRINFIALIKLRSNASGFDIVTQLTAHELKTSMRVIHGLSYIIEKNDEDKLSEKSKDNLALLRGHILELNNNLEHLKDRASEHH